jgi:hypothetical protein
MKTTRLLQFVASSTVATVLVLAAALPAFAQWTPVPDVPATILYSVWANGDTLVATADSVVYVSTNGGAAWKGSATVVAGAHVVSAARVHNGRLYAGTFGQGVFVSDDLGDTWLGFNQDLVGGFEDTQLKIVELVVSGNKLHAATAGDGAWRRDLAGGTWSRFGDIFEPSQAANMSSMTVGGTRLLACASTNGTVYYRDPGDSDWTESLLKNVVLSPGTGPFTAIFTGSHWLVGTNTGLYHSAQGQSPWTFVNIGLGPQVNVVFAARPSIVFASFGTSLFANIEYSLDNGASWQVLDTLPGTFIFGLATHDNTLYAARLDGLWQRSIATVAVHPTSWGSIKALYRKPGK